MQAKLAGITLQNSFRIVKFLKSSRQPERNGGSLGERNVEIKHRAFSKLQSVFGVIDTRYSTRIFWLCKMLHPEDVVSFFIVYPMATVNGLLS